MSLLPEVIFQKFYTAKINSFPLCFILKQRMQDQKESRQDYWDVIGLNIFVYELLIGSWLLVVSSKLCALLKQSNANNDEFN